MRIPKNKWLSLSLYVLAVLLIGYQMLNYAGLYRLVSDLQTNLLGFYLPYVSILPLGVFLVPGLVTAPAPDPAEEEARLAEENSFPTYEEWMIHQQEVTLTIARRHLPRAWALTLAATAVVFLVPEPTPPPPVTVDLARLGNAAPPVGVPVILRGMPDDNLITLSRHGTRLNEDVSTVSVGGPGPGGSYRFFALLGRHDDDTRNALAEFDRTGGRSGYLSENGLDNETRGAFERAGFRVATPHYLLGDARPLTANNWVRIVAVLFGLYALIFSIMALVALWARRKYRRQLAGY
jgi:hypothetical protein